MFQAQFVDKTKTYILFSITFFFENRACFVIMLKNIVQPDRQHMTIRPMCIACWITKATNTHSEYVIFIVFPPQQWLHERALMLRNTYSACLVFIIHSTEMSLVCFSKEYYCTSCQDVTLSDATLILTSIVRMTVTDFRKLKRYSFGMLYTKKYSHQVL